MKITIPVATHRSGYLAIEAEPITIAGINLALHRAVQRKKAWTVTDPLTGLSLGLAPTKEAARHAAASRISQVGADTLKDILATKPHAPPVHALKAYSRPEEHASPSVDVDAIIAAVGEAVGGLSDAEAAGVKLALNSRTGQLKSKCPAGFGMAAAAWQGLQPNAYKISVGRCLFIQSEEARALLNKLIRIKWPHQLDKDMTTLIAVGAW